MVKTKLSNGLVGGFGCGGGAMVLQNLIRFSTNPLGMALDLFVIFELFGFFLIYIAVFINFKY